MLINPKVNLINDFLNNLEVFAVVEDFASSIAAILLVSFGYMVTDYSIRWIRRATDEDPLTLNISDAEDESDTNFLSDEKYQDF